MRMQAASQPSPGFSGVSESQKLTFDAKETHSGRGMWVHQDCLETAFQKHLFHKAAKGTVRISDELSAQMKKLFNITVEADKKTERRPL